VLDVVVPEVVMVAGVVEAVVSGVVVVDVVLDDEVVWLGVFSPMPCT
jgi:hypothetical protein